MSDWDKIEAVSALEAHGLMRVPIRVVRRPHQMSTRALGMCQVNSDTEQ